MSNERGIIEGVQPQGVDEIIVYTVTTTNIGSDPSSPSVTVWDVDAGYTDVTDTVMPSGSAAAVGDVITLPALRSLTRGRNYLVMVQCVIDGNTITIPFGVLCQR